eukprot:TRINITY_DN36882_c0_g1_i1.p1 TRINITY_DN36882_c0_g1~~TRINITY_DN36882_c0_g1_i1.p1  ORF type:complete len:1198 (+),score=218.59 TRINITY_DN36882_c0_g1_i1:81-3674(+)
MYPPRSRLRSPSPRSTSPLPGRSLRLGQRDEVLRAEMSRELPLPGSLAPSLSLQPQAVASRRCFAAGPSSSLLSISGGCILQSQKCPSRVTQELRVGPRPRPLTCLAVSTCGNLMAVGESCGGGRPGQILILSSDAAEEMTTIAVGPRRIVRHICWAAKGDLLAAIVESETDQVAGGDQQLMVWHWRDGERLAASACGRGTQDLAGSPDSEAMFLLTVGPCGAKIWSLLKPQELRATSPGRARSSSVGCVTSLPLRLVGRNVPLTSGALARGNAVGGAAGRRRPPEDALVAAVWGTERSYFLATRQGGLGSGQFSELSQIAATWRQMGRKAYALAWARRVCGRERGSHGLLACALAGGVIEVLDASDMVTLFSLMPSGGGPSDAIGLSCSFDGEGLWALYSDKSLAHWASDGEKPETDWSMAPATGDLREAHALPGMRQKVISSSAGKVQLWTAMEGSMLRLEAQTEPAAPKSGDITAVAVSPWIVATGHAGGEVRLLAALHNLQLLEPMPTRHAGEVLALSFGHWKPASLRQLLLVSVSRDRSAMVFSIDLRHGAPALQSSCATLLLHLQQHSSAVQRAALLVASSLGANGKEVFRLAVCTADQQLVLREIEHGESSSTVRKSTRTQAPRAARWVGICAHYGRSVFFAACNDRRLMQLDQGGRLQQEMRLAGTSAAELAGPLRLSADGRILAVGLGGAAGVLLVDVEIGLQPLARLAAGQAEPPSGIALLPGIVTSAVACWQDGTILSWEAPSEQVEASAVRRTSIPAQTVHPRARHEAAPSQSEGSQRRAGSPRLERDTVTASGNVRGRLITAAARGPQRSSPKRGRQGPGPAATAVTGHPVSPSSSFVPPSRAGNASSSFVPPARHGSPPPSSSRSGPAAGRSPVVARVVSESVAEGELSTEDRRQTIDIQRAIKAQIGPELEVSDKQEEATEDKFQSPKQEESSRTECRNPEQYVERLMALSPSPPRWAEPITASAAGSARVLDTRQLDSTGLGKWARGSVVGAQIRSASDLHRFGQREPVISGVESSQVRAASEGAQATRGWKETGPIQRRLFHSPAANVKPLPPKPAFPPPQGAEETEKEREDTMDLTAISCSSSQPITAVPTNISLVPEPVTTCSHESKGNISLASAPASWLSLPTPSRANARNKPSETKAILEKLPRLHAQVQEQLGPQDVQEVQKLLKQVEGILREQL